MSCWRLQLSTEVPGLAMPAGAAATAKAQGGVFWVESEACYGYVVRRGEAGARNRMSCKGYATAAEAEAARRGVLQAAQVAEQVAEQEAAELNQPRHSARRGLHPSGFRAWQPAVPQMVERELQRKMLELREPAGSLFHAFVSQVMVHDFEAVPAHLLHYKIWTPVEALLESLRKYHADAAAVTVRELRVLIQHKYAAHSFYQSLRYADWVKRLMAPGGAPKRVYVVQFPFQRRFP